MASFIDEACGMEVTPKDSRAFQPLEIAEIGFADRDLVWEVI
jgi:hypothetical protein